MWEMMRHMFKNKAKPDYIYISSDEDSDLYGTLTNVPSWDKQELFASLLFSRTNVLSDIFAYKGKKGV